MTETHTHTHLTVITKDVRNVNFSLKENPHFLKKTGIKTKIQEKCKV